MVKPIKQLIVSVSLIVTELKKAKIEDTIHVLRDCPKEVWMHMVPIDQQHRFFSGTFQVRLSSNLCYHMRLQEHHIIWSCLFGLITWHIWKNMNIFIFLNVTWSTIEIVKASIGWAQQYELNHDGYNNNAHNSSYQTISDGTWVHLFTDGVVARITGNVFAGNVLRDQFKN